MSNTPGSTSQHLAKAVRKSDIYHLDHPDSGMINVRLYLTEGPVRIISVSTCLYSDFVCVGGGGFLIDNFS